MIAGSLPTVPVARRPRRLFILAVVTSLLWQTVHQNRLSLLQFAAAIAPTHGTRTHLSGAAAPQPLHRSHHAGRTSTESAVSEKIAPVGGSEKAASQLLGAEKSVDPLVAVSFASTRASVSASATMEFRCYRYQKGSGATTVETREDIVAEEDCQRACRTRKECTHAELNKAQRKCHLKTGYFDIVDGDTDTVTVPRSCSSSCFSKNTHASIQEILSPKEMYSPFDCLIWCTTQPQCKYWDYNILNSKCYLKPEAGLNAKKEMTGSVFGSSEWCPDDDAGDSSVAQGWNKSGSCMHPQNSKASGTPLKELANTSNADLCQKHCKKMPSCRYFTFDRNSKFCSLLNGSRVEVTEAQGFVSGPRSCNQSCFLEGQKYQRGEMSSEKVYSALDCQVLCQTTEACEYFSFTKTSRLCQLFNSDAKSTELATSGTTSGPKDWCS
uniref:PAN domain-containing protein n=1 Tax=Toxoplasma gondii COUG TaxID=1074873 RepID=A0A2G8XUD9_TOXGO|nr:PAN domain-containing protein [Toxoplasma gondii COUG]